MSSTSRMNRSRTRIRRRRSRRCGICWTWRATTASPGAGTHEGSTSHDVPLLLPPDRHRVRPRDRARPTTLQGVHRPDSVTYEETIMKFQCCVCELIFDFNEVMQAETENGAVVFIDRVCYEELDWQDDEAAV